jgi:TonB-linked SusC/RagA family outer membrane protein
MKTNPNCRRKGRKIGSGLPKPIAALFLLTTISVTPVFAQVQQRITLRMVQATAEQLIVRIGETTRYRISYLGDDLRQVPRRDYSFTEATIEQVMDNLVAGTDIEWSDSNGTIVIARRNAGNDLQTIGIHGSVKDERGDPLTGATVSVKGEARGTVTDADGTYAIRIERGKTLVFSYVGFMTQEIVAGTQTELNIVLKSNRFLIDQVVVSTGYQEIAMGKMTGSTATVTSDELSTRYTPTVMDNLEGRVAGLMRYGGKTSIRGTSSIHADTSPLAVVDGLPFEGSLEDINPYDVESITVLKDAAATAVYGARASNGIIVITTRQAGEKGKTTVDVSANFTIRQKPDYSKYNYMTPARQVDFESDYYDWYFNGGTIADPVREVTNLIEKGSYVNPVQYAYYRFAQGQLDRQGLDALLDGYRSNDFARQFREHALRNRFTQQYNIAVRSRGEKFQSNLVLNFKRDNTGIIEASENRVNMQYRGTYDMAGWLNVNFGVNIVLDEDNESNSSFADSPFNVPPYMQLIDDNGDRVYYATSDYNSHNPLTIDNPAMEGMLVNHLEELGRDREKTSRQKTRYFANMKISILRGLTFNPQFQYENDRTGVSAYSEEESYVMRYLKNIYTSRSGSEGNYAYNHMLPAGGGKLATVNTKGDSWTARGQANYMAEVGKHYVEAIAGTEFRQTRVEGTRGLLLGYDDQLQSHATTSVDFPALAAVTSTTLFKPGLNPGGIYRTYIGNAMEPVAETTHRFNSIYVNATYTYDGKYNVFASFRKDYADVFGLDKKYRGKPLWSAGLGWNIHEQGFMHDVEWIDFLKLRASYGVTGNMYLGATSYLTANSSLLNNATKLPVSVVEAPDNPQLRWEKNATLNFGVDFSLFDNRLGGALDVYRKKGSDIFATTRMDPTEGFTEMIINNGDLLNKGVELNLNYTWLVYLSIT